MIDLINLALVMQMLIVWVGGAKCFMVLEFRPRVATVTTPEFISYLIYRILTKENWEILASCFFPMIFEREIIN